MWIEEYRIDNKNVGREIQEWKWECWQRNLGMIIGMLAEEYRNIEYKRDNKNDRRKISKKSRCEEQIKSAWTEREIIRMNQKEKDK